MIGQAPHLNPEDVSIVGPDYSTLYREGCFAQRPLINASNLHEMAKVRRLQLPLFPKSTHLEPMARLGAFSPVAFRFGGFTTETIELHPNPRHLLWTEETHPGPWIDFAWVTETIEIPTISECYSPWQILYLDEAINLFEKLRSEVSPHQILLKRMQTLDEEWRPLIKLLVALQPRLWSYRRGKSSLVFDGQNQIDVTQWAQENFEPSILLRRFDLSLDRLARMHLNLLEAALELDPAPGWHELAESAPRPVTDQFRGEARRALDLYDAAFLLRGLYFLIANDWLPRPDQLNLDNTVSYYRRRHLPVRPQGQDSRRLDLKGQLVRLGIYPHRIHFFVEGATEQIILEKVLDLIGYGTEGSGMAVTSIDSVDALKRHELLVRIASEVASSTVLIADREGTLLKMLERLRNEGLFVDPIDVLVWGEDGGPADFEDANFSEADVLDAISRVVANRAPDLKFDITFEDLSTYRSHGARKGQPLAKVALALAQERHFPVSKRELAEELGDFLCDEIRAAGHLSELADARPLLGRLLLWIQRDRDRVAKSAGRSI